MEITICTVIQAKWYKTVEISNQILFTIRSVDGLDSPIRTEWAGRLSPIGGVATWRSLLQKKRGVDLSIQTARSTVVVPRILFRSAQPNLRIV